MENIVEFIQKIPELLSDYIPYILQFIGAIAVGVTALFKIPPLKKNAEKVDAPASKFFELANKLPSLGVNPRTQKLEELYKELKENKPSE